MNKMHRHALFASFALSLVAATAHGADAVVASPDGRTSTARSEAPSGGPPGLPVFCTPLLAAAGLGAARFAQAQGCAQVATGPFTAAAESLRKSAIPTWFRDAKLGIWSHWGPQAVPSRGDWYARFMYVPGHPHYEHHVKTYGHPSEVGYKDIIKLWKAERFEPEALMDRYVAAGAKYFVSMGVHHDNFDLWNSKHHRWNATKVGPMRDVVGEWGRAARKRGLRFGVSELLMTEMATWMKVNAEAIHGTRPWKIHGEGPTEAASGAFKESADYTAQDIRFTTRGDALYALTLGEPKGTLKIASLRHGSDHEPRPVRRVELLGGGTLKFRQTAQALEVDVPERVPSRHASALRIARG